MLFSNVVMYFIILTTAATLFKAGKTKNKPDEAKKFYWILVISTAAAIEINFLGINPVSALVWAAVLNGLLAPPLLVLIMLIGSRKKIMKQHTNGVVLNTLAWATTLAMSIATIALVASWLRG